MKQIIMDGFVSQKYMGKDVQIQATQSGKQFILFSVNSTTSRKDESGNFVNVANYFDCKYWLKNDKDKNASLILGAGRNKMFFIGEPVQEKWQGKDGKEHSKVSFIIRDVFGERGEMPEVQESSEVYYDSDCPFN